LISLAEFSFPERIFKKYGGQRQMLVLEKMKHLYPGTDETQSFLETMITSRIKILIRENSKRELRQIYNNILGIIAHVTGCLSGCVF